MPEEKIQDQEHKYLSKVPVITVEYLFIHVNLPMAPHHIQAMNQSQYLDL